MLGTATFEMCQRAMRPARSAPARRRRRFQRPRKWRSTSAGADSGLSKEAPAGVSLQEKRMRDMAGDR
jgi:hypothetical protein